MNFGGGMQGQGMAPPQGTLGTVGGGSMMAPPMPQGVQGNPQAMQPYMDQIVRMLGLMQPGMPQLGGSAPSLQQMPLQQAQAPIMQGQQPFNFGGGIYGRQ
jgi:hypothetical protein